MDSEIISKIQIAAMNGLTRQEVEALIGYRLNDEQLQAFNKARAISKLKAKQERRKLKQEITAQVKSKVQENTQSTQLKAPISKRFTSKEVLNIISRTHGLTSSICAALDCSNNQWQVYLRKRPDIKKAQEEARESIVDLAEKRLVDNLNSPDDSLAQRAVEFILKHMGTKRGWSDLHSAQQINIQDKDGNTQVSINQIFGITDDTNG